MSVYNKTAPGFWGGIQRQVLDNLLHDSSLNYPVVYFAVFILSCVLLTFSWKNYLIENSNILTVDWSIIKISVFCILFKVELSFDSQQQDELDSIEGKLRYFRGWVGLFSFWTVCNSECGFISRFPHSLEVHTVHNYSHSHNFCHCHNLVRELDLSKTPYR